MDFHIDGISIFRHTKQKQQRPRHRSPLPRSRQSYPNEKNNKASSTTVARLPVKLRRPPPPPLMDTYSPEENENDFSQSRWQRLYSRNKNNLENSIEIPTLEHHSQLLSTDSILKELTNHPSRNVIVVDEDKDSKLQNWFQSIQSMADAKAKKEVKAETSNEDEMIGLKKSTIHFGSLSNDTNLELTNDILWQEQQGQRFGVDSDKDYLGPKQLTETAALVEENQEVSSILESMLKEGARKDSESKKEEKVNPIGVGLRDGNSMQVDFKNRQQDDEIPSTSILTMFDPSSVFSTVDAFFDHSNLSNNNVDREFCSISSLSKMTPLGHTTTSIGQQNTTWNDKFQLPQDQCVPSSNQITSGETDENEEKVKLFTTQNNVPQITSLSSLPTPLPPPPPPPKILHSEKTLEAILHTFKNHLRHKLLYQILSSLRTFISQENDRTHRFQKYLLRRKRTRIKRRLFQTWNHALRSRQQKMESFIQIQQRKKLRNFFFTLAESAARTRSLLQKRCRELEWRLSSKIFSEWKKVARCLKLERQNAMEKIRKAEELARFQKACRWHRQNVLTSVFLGWQMVARMERRERELKEAKDKRRGRVKAFMERINAEKKKKEEENRGGSDDDEVEEKVKRRNEITDFKENVVPLVNGMDEEPTLQAIQSLLTQCLSGKNQSFTSSKSSIPVIERHSPNDNISIHPKPLPNSSKKMSNISSPRLSKQSTPKLVINMEKRHQERAQRRKELNDRYHHAKILREEKMQRAVAEKERKTQQLLLGQKQQKRNEEEEKKRIIQRKNEQWKLACLHSKLKSIKMGLNQWKEFMKDLKLKEQKARTHFCDVTLQKSMEIWKEYVEQVQQHLVDLEKIKMRSAYEHYQNRLMKQAWKALEDVVLNSRKKVEIVTLRHWVYVSTRMFEKWHVAMQDERLMLCKIEREASVVMRLIWTRFWFKKWKLGKEVMKREKKEEEKVAAKWIQVRQWLEKSTS